MITPHDHVPGLVARGQRGDLDGSHRRGDIDDAQTRGTVGHEGDTADRCDTHCLSGGVEGGDLARGSRCGDVDDAQAGTPCRHVGVVVDQGEVGTLVREVHLRGKHRVRRRRHIEDLEGSAVADVGACPVDRHRGNAGLDPPPDQIGAVLSRSGQGQTDEHRQQRGHGRRAAWGGTGRL